MIEVQLEKYRDIVIESISVIVKKKEVRGFRFQCNGRMDFGLVFITDGEGYYEDEEGNKSSLKQNDVVIVEQGFKYIIGAKNDGFEYITTAFHVYTQNAFKQLELPPVVSISDSEKTIKSFYELLDVWEVRSSLYRMEARILLARILLDIVRMNDNSLRFQGVGMRVSPALTYINQHFDKPIYLSGLAELCNMSVSNFRKLFFENIGISPIRYRELIRIDWAKRLLDSNLLNVSEIAEKLGYNDIYHFSKNFKKETGESPLDYKKKHVY